MAMDEAGGAGVAQDGSLRGRVYVVFGASGGIGLELTRDLVARGASVLMAARREGPLEEAARGLEGVATRSVDARDFAAVDAALEDARERWGRVDGVVNAVGSVLLKPVHRVTAEEWRETVGQNLDTAFAVVRAAAPAMKATGGSIVLISSAAARIGLPNHEAIAAVKAGIVGLVQSAAASLAAQNIRVNAVAPGLVETGLTQHLTRSEASRQYSLAMHPLGRLGTPGDVARAIAFLLDPQNSWITGQVLGVDGGLGGLKLR